MADIPAKSPGNADEALRLAFDRATGALKVTGVTGGSSIVQIGDGTTPANKAAVKNTDATNATDYGLVTRPAVTKGSGVVDAFTQRVTLATDVALPAGEAHLGAVGGAVLNPSSSFTRPTDTTPYAANDAVADNTAAGSVTPLQWTIARVAAGSFALARVRLRKSTTSITNASFRLHLWSATITPAAGDNAAMVRPASATYLGYVDVTCDQAFSDGATGQMNCAMLIKLGSGSAVFGLVEALAAYTPGNGETFAFTLESSVD